MKCESWRFLLLFSRYFVENNTGPKPTITPPKPIIASTINTTLVKVGQESKITCTNPLPIQQYFPYNNQMIIYRPDPLATSYTFIFNTWEEFDVNSTLTSSCNPTTSYMQAIEKSASNPTVVTKRYTNDKFVYFDCSCYCKDYSKYVNVTLVRNNTVKVFLEDRVNRTFTVQDNGSILSCYVFVDKRASGTRYFYNKTMLIYQENNDRLTVNEDWMIGVGAVVVSIIIIIIIITLTIMMYKKKSRLLPLQSEPTKATNTNPDQVLYANLDMTPMQKCDQNSPVEESPYATIMSPDRVIYAELSLQNNNRRPEKIESPYAEVFVSSAHGQHIKR